MDILNYNWIFPDISNSVCLVARVCVCVCVLFSQRLQKDEFFRDLNCIYELYQNMEFQ